MAEQAGLGGAPQQGGQAGLNDPGMTMGERYRLSRAMMRQGYTSNDIRTALGMENAPPPGQPEAEVEEPTVGFFGDLGYGARAGGQSLLSGAGEFAEDVLGWDGTSDTLKSLAEYVGPSEAQEEAQRAEAAYRQEQVDSGQMSGTEQFAREAGDAIVESAPGMLGVLAAGWAGAKVGAAGGAVAGSVVPGAGTGAGAVVGGIIGSLGGAIAASFPMMYDEQLKTAEANGLDRDDPEVQEKALTGAAFNTALDSVVPLKILSTINKTGAADIAMKAIAKRGAKDFIKDGITEGATEVAQMATGAILFDPNVSKLAKEDRAALFPYVAQTYGREIAMNFIAGAALGGPLGGAAGMREQALANAKIKTSASVLSKAAETTGAPVEGLQELIKTPDGARKVSQAADELQLAEIKRQNAKSMLDAEPTPERKKAFAKIDAEADAVYDRWMPEFGGRKLTEVRAEREQLQDVEKQGAFAKLRAEGLKPKADASYEALIGAASRVQKAAADLAQVEDRLSVAEQPKQRQRVQADYDAKLKTYAKEKAEAARAVGDTSITEASVIAGIEKGKGREKAVNRDLARNYPKWMTPEQQVARAGEIIAKSKANPDAEIIEQHRKLAAKQAKLLPESAEYARVQSQIDRLGDRMGGTSPAVEAAQRVLQRFGKGSQSAAPGSSPGGPALPATEAAAKVDAGGDGEGGAASARPAAPLTPADVPGEMITRLADARAASKVDDTLTPQTEAVARELLTAAGAEPSQANVDTLVRGKGAIAKRLAAIVPTAERKPRMPAEDARTKGYEYRSFTTAYPWTHLMNVVGPEADLDEAEATLRAWTARTGQEASATFDDAGNLLGAGTNKDMNGVMPPANGWGTTATTFTHTHPDETPFSLADVWAMASQPVYKLFRAVTPTQVLEMRPGPNVGALANEEAVYRAFGPVQERVRAMLPADVDRIMAARIEQEVTLRLLAEKGVIQYDAPMRRLTQFEEDVINDNVEALALSFDLADDGGGAAQRLDVVPRAPGADPAGAGRTQAGAEPSVARGRAPTHPDFLAAWRNEVPNEELIQRPEFVAAVGKLLTTPLTSRRPGFNTPEWHATRVYSINGEEVTGTAAAMDAFVDQALGLAAQELGLPVRPPRNERILTILTGPPASGKSTVANEVAYAQGAAILDSDEFKKALPEFGDGSGANAVHAESKVLADAVEDILMAEGVNVVYPKVGHESGSITKLARRFRAAGYRVNLVNLDVPPQTAMRRMLGRFGQTGRLIPPSYLLEEVSDNPSRVHNEMEREGEFDGYARLDGLTPYGRSPEVLSQTGDALAGTPFAVPGGSPAERGRAAAQPGDAGNRGGAAPQAGRQPVVARGIDEEQDALEAEGIGESRGVRGRSRVDRAALRDISSSVIEWAKVQPRRGNAKQPFLSLAPDLSVEQVSKATDALISGVAASSGHAMIKAGGILSPAANQQVMLALGLGLANAISAQGKGRFQHRSTRVWDKAAGKPKSLSSLSLDDRLKAYFKVGALGFLPPMADPNDTSQIKLDGARNLMSGPALERAEATARMLQAQRYTIDEAAVAAIVANPDVLISKKTRGEREVLANSRATIANRLAAIKAAGERLERADIKAVADKGLSNYNLDKMLKAIKDAAAAMTLEDLGFRPQRGPLPVEDIERGTARLAGALQPLGESPDYASPISSLRRSIRSATSDNLSAQRDLAKQRAGRLKEYADGAQGREIGFRYGIDKKGRLYPDGEFHHQSGDAIKGIFRSVDAGQSLGDMDSFDHTGSGWQIAALIARDATIAARVNITGGMASNPNPPKGDIYTGVVGKIVAQIERDVAAGNPLAALFKSAIMDPVLEERGGGGKTFAELVRPDFKTPVIAVNYGGSDRQFRDVLINAYSDKLRGDIPSAFWAYFEGVGGDAIRSEAPDVMRFKDWALRALEGAVKSTVERGVDPGTLAFTVGPDAKYSAVKKKLQPSKQIEAQDSTPGAAIPALSVVIREPVAPDDPLKGVDYPKTAKNIFSQIIQGYDAAVMHDAVARYRAAVPGGFMATNHDSYTVPDENRQALATAVNEALFAMIQKGGNVGERLRQEIIDQTGFDPGEPPALGSYNLEDVRTSMPVWREGKDGAADSPMSVPAPVVARGMDVPQAERRVPDQAGSTGVQLTNSLANSFALAATKQYRTGRELKLDLDARSRAAQAEQGIDLTTLTPETAARLSDFAVEDALEALQDNANAVGWYDNTVTRALAELEQLHPELKTDTEARLKFIWALAVTSNGIKVDRNFQMANIAYEYSKEGHATTFPTDLGAGDAARAINGGLRMYDILLEKLGGVDPLLEFMTTKRTVKEVERISGVSVSGEGKSEIVYGAAILGPKIGNGFFANLYGNFDALTMDRWLMRSVGRWRGTLVTPNEPMIAAKRDGMKALIRGLTPEQIKYLQGFFNGSPVKIKKIISSTEIDALAAEVAKRSMAPSWRENLSQTSEGNTLRLLGNALTGYLDGQNEAPGGATERTFLRKVFNSALDRLRAMPGNEALTMADLQALLWYPERRLYDAAKSSGDQQKGYADDEAPDYANAARKLVRGRLGSDAGSGPGTGGSGPRADAGAPVVARGTDGPDVRQRRARAGDYGGSPRAARPDERIAGGPVRSVREFDDGRHVYETDPDTFSRAMTAARVNLGPVAAQVGDDTGDRQFLLDDGATGFALSGNDIISVFSTPGVSQRGAAARMLQAAVAEGGQTLNAFDTFLPQLYAKSGFRSVARLPFNREYAPEGWDYEFFLQKYGTDEPDVVFMVYDPDNATSKTDNVIADYDDGLAAQARALKAPAVARGLDRGVAMPSPEVQFRLSNTAKRPRERVANVRHDLTPYDADIALAIVLDRGRNGPIMREVQINSARTMRDFIEGTRLGAADRREMLLAVDEYERQKTSFAPSFRPMDKDMARDILEQMGGLLTDGRLDEARIGRQLGYTREKASAVAKEARAAYARSSMPKPAISRGINSLFFTQPVAKNPLPGISNPGAESAFARAQRAAQDGSILRRIGRGIERQVLNKQAGLKQIERAIGADSTNVRDGMSRMAQMMTASSGRVAAMLQYGAPKWDPVEKVFTYAPGTKGLTQIFSFKDGDDYNRFEGWAFAKRDRGLMARGKGARMTDALRTQYEAIPAADKLRYDAMLDEYRKFNEAMLDLMVDSGLIGGEQRAALSQDQEYVPMFRTFEDAADFGMQGFFGKDGGFSHPDPGIRKLLDNPAKVGEPNGGEFGDLIAGIHSGAIAALHAAQQNIGHAQIYDFMTGNLGHEVKTIKAKTGVEVKTLGRGTKKKAFNALEQDAVKFYRDGKEVYWKAAGTNTEMTNALQMALAGLQPRQLDGLDRALKAFNSFQRTVITSTPGFALASIQRDVGQTYVQSGTRINEVLRNNAQQFREAITGASQGTKDLMMAAGVGGYQMQGMPENDAGAFRRKVGAQSSTLWNYANNWLSNYERFIGSTELGARSAVAEGVTRKGGSKADAAYEALNMIDYNRSGASPLVQRLLYMILFLNPRLQGLYRLFEETKGNSPKKIAAVSASVLARGLVLTGIAMTIRMLTAMNEEDEEAYGNLSTSDRASYMHIPLPGSDRFLKLPQPFEIGAIFSTLPVQFFDSMYSSQNGVNDLGRMVGHTLVNTFSLNPVPQAVIPMAELYMNMNMFNGMPIEGQRLEGLPKELRIDLSTGGIAQALGGGTLSPVQVQHLLDGYLGPLGSFLFAAVEGTMAGAGLVSDKATSSDGVFGSLPAPLRDTANFTVGRFISKTDAERSTRFVTEFYDLSNSVKQYTSAINEAVRMGDLAGARRLVEENRELLRFKPFLASVTRTLSEINRQLRVAQFSVDMSPEERQRRIDILNTKKNQLVRAAVERIRSAGMTGSFTGGLIGAASR
jgi:predicted kinase